MATRTYPSGALIPDSLPKAYAPASNKKQYCGNCSFYKKRMCGRWNAPVRAGYVCAAWNARKSSTSVSAAAQGTATTPVTPTAPQAPRRQPTSQPRRTQRTTRRSYGY